MVFNHAWADHPYYQMYPPLFGANGEMLQDLNPFFHHHHNGHANSWGGLDWDHSSQYTVAYMQDIVRFWLEEYHVDGFRFDWVGGVEYDPFQPHTDSFDPFSGIAPIARAARETAPNCYLIGEYWPIHGTNPAKTAARLVRETEIDAVWNGAFHHALENCLFQTWQWERQEMPAVLGGFRKQGFRAADQIVNYVVQPRRAPPGARDPVLGRPHSAGATRKNGDGSASHSRWELALQKARLGLAVLLTSPGVPMLLAGQEFGDDCPRTIEFWPLDWGKLGTAAGTPAVRFGATAAPAATRAPGAAVRLRRVLLGRLQAVQGGALQAVGPAYEDVVVVAVNFDNIPQKVGLGFPPDGWWRNPLAGTRHRVQGHWRDFTVPAWTALVFVQESAAPRQS